MADPTDGFTPVPEAIVRECGPIAALVWGVVWRYCQMQDGVCWASQATIARRAGLCRRSVTRHLRTLVAAGYLEVSAADPLGRARSYADTGRARIGKAAVAPGDEPHTCDQESQPGHTCDQESHDNESPAVAPAQTACDRKSHGCDSESQGGVTGGHRGCAPESQPPVTASHTKRVPKTESKTDPKETEQHTRGVPPPVCRDDQDPDESDYQDPHDGYNLVAECLADFFARMTGIPVPIPRNDKELRQAHTLWSAPLAEIAALCGSTLVGQRVIASSLATLRGKRCIVKAPLSILRHRPRTRRRGAHKARRLERHQRSPP